MSETPTGAPDASALPDVQPGDGSLAQERCRRRSSISGASGLVAVLGDPVRHSLSPAMHNAALQELGLDWVYLALRTPPGRLAAVLAGLEAVECRGLNITLPHKAEAAQLAQDLSPLAARLGAVNTLVPRSEGGWFGANTDVEGFLAPLRSCGVPWQGQQALVLGNGGSARAIARIAARWPAASRPSPNWGWQRSWWRAGANRAWTFCCRPAVAGPPPWRGCLGVKAICDQPLVAALWW